jgi:hypothetical protein
MELAIKEPISVENGYMLGEEEEAVVIAVQ